MRVAIIPLPLHTNYGGILQAYALKKSIEALGHSVDVIDRKCKIVPPPRWKMPFIYIKRTLLQFRPKSRRPEIFRERRILREFPKVSSLLHPFVTQEVSPRMVRGYNDIALGEYDAFVVGSDQVWRPRYFGRIEEAFLDFTSRWNVRRIAYAASFGTEQLEYSYEQLEACSALLKGFKAVSVREAGAVTLCDEWFDREDAVHVLDPVMLLPAGHYAEIARKSSEHPAKGKVLSYILDTDPSKKAVLQKVKGWLGGMPEHDAYIPDRDPRIPLARRIVPPMEQWLSCFADAEFVVTDSFHGCVLSILFHKPFIALANPSRGMSRVQSLLESFQLEDRIVQGLDPDDDGEYYLADIDWDRIDARLEELKASSLSFLTNALK